MIKLNSVKMHLKTVQSFLHLIRIISCLAGSFLAWQISVKHGVSLIYSSFYAIIFFFTLAGAFALNAATDYEEDCINTPLRPVSSGAISARMSLILSTIFYMIAALTSMFLTPLGISLVFLIIFTSILYSFYWCKLPGIKNIGVAASTASIVIIPAIDQSRFTMEDFAIATSIFLFMLQKEIIGDVRDILGDLSASKPTLVIKSHYISIALVSLSNILLMLVVTFAIYEQFLCPWFSIRTIILLMLNSIVVTCIVLYKETKAAGTYVKFAKAVYLLAVLTV